jgi:hypothetical protein
MATTTPSAALVPVAPVFTNTERLALAGFFAAYSGLTRQAYELDLRQFADWCVRAATREPPHGNPVDAQLAQDGLDVRRSRRSPGQAWASSRRRQAGRN